MTTPTTLDPLAECPGCNHGLMTVHDAHGRCHYPGCVCGLRDAARGADARDEGMARAAATQAVTAEWKALALGAIKTVAARQAELSSSDVVEYLTERGEEPPPGSKVMGPIIRKAVSLGYIDGPIRTRSSDRVSQHRGLENVWRSKLFTGGP